MEVRQRAINNHNTTVEEHQGLIDYSQPPDQDEDVEPIYDGVNDRLGIVDLLHPSAVFIFSIVTMISTVLMLGIGLLQPGDTDAPNKLDDFLSVVALYLPRRFSLIQSILHHIFFLSKESSFVAKLQRSSQVLYTITVIVWLTKELELIPKIDWLIYAIVFIPKMCMLIHLGIIIRIFLDLLLITYNDFILDTLLTGCFAISSMLAGNDSVRARRQHSDHLYCLICILWIFFLLVSYRVLYEVITWFKGTRFSDRTFRKDECRMKTFLHRYIKTAMFEQIQIYIVPNWLMDIKIKFRSLEKIGKNLVCKFKQIEFVSLFTPKREQTDTRITAKSLQGDSSTTPRKRTKESWKHLALKEEETREKIFKKAFIGCIRKTCEYLVIMIRWVPIVLFFYMIPIFIFHTIVFVDTHFMSNNY